MEAIINDLSAKLKVLNSRRMSLLVLNSLIVVVFTVIYFIAALYLTEHYGVNRRLIRYASLPLIYFIYYNLKKKKDVFNKLYDDFIIGDILGSSYPDWSYNQEATIEEDMVYQTFLVNKGSSMDIINQISGEIGRTQFNFAELKILKNQYAGGRLPKKIFQGYFFVFDNNKVSEARLFVRPGLLKDFGSADFKEKKILTDTTEFDKRFLTYSNDPIKARYILTPALMARILDFEKQYPNMISFLFDQDKLYIAFKGNKNFLEPSLFKKITSDTISRQMDIFRLIGKIVEELNIDNNIWRDKEPSGGQERV